MDRKVKFWFLPLVVALAVVCGLLAIVFVLRSEGALVAHPKGWIALRERNLIALNYLLMLIIIIPTFIWLFVVVWGHYAKRDKYDPEHTHGAIGQVMLWVVPAVVVAVMTTVTWYAAHALDPYLPLKSDTKPLTIQVVALDWKWLFIYPEEGIATVNFVQFPEKTPIHFELSADGSPMNSFWIPQLSGQIYSMAGMTTHLHVIADEPGEYAGRAAEINGPGFAGMTFVAKASSPSDFEKWVASVKTSPLALNEQTYSQLAKPSKDNPVALYSLVEKDLFNKIIMKYMNPTL